MCGHATLAAAHALYETKRVPRLATISFHTLRSGILTAQENNHHLIELNFPSLPITEKTIQDFPDLYLTLSKAFQLESTSNILYLGQSKYDILIEISLSDFVDLSFDSINFQLVKSVGGRGVIVTCAGPKRSQADITKNLIMTKSAQIASNKLPMDDLSLDFFSRCFFPK